MTSKKGMITVLFTMISYFLLAQENHQYVFWKALQSHCGQAFSGVVVHAPPGDTVFANKALTMHIRQCSEQVIHIPFFVGDDQSRTWVLTKSEKGILLKHDHRKPDGSHDPITQYGGLTSNSGMAGTQFFPADEETVVLLPAAAGNVWWMEIKENEYFNYNLRRLGTDRYFIVRFDLSKPQDPPPAPWGWED